jgi:hypothetical protein
LTKWLSVKPWLHRGDTHCRAAFIPRAKTGESGETRALLSFFDFELRFSSAVSLFSPAGFDEWLSVKPSLHRGDTRRRAAFIPRAKTGETGETRVLIRSLIFELLRFVLPFLPFLLRVLTSGCR